MYPRLTRAILGELQLDARQSMNQLAARLGVASGTVRSRLVPLREQEVIRRHTVLLDYAALGYDWEVMIRIRVRPDHLPTLRLVCLDQPNLLDIHELEGGQTILARGRFQGPEPLNRFLKALQSHPGTISTNTELITSTLRQQGPFFAMKHPRDSVHGGDGAEST